MEEKQSEQKIGVGHAGAMFRQGLSELRGILYPESNVAQPSQIGLYGTMTQGEVMKERGVLGRDVDEQSMSVEEPALTEARPEDVEPPTQDEPDLEME